MGSQVSFDRQPDGTVCVRLAGTWNLENEWAEVGDVQKEADGGPAVRRVSFDASGLGEWDSSLLTFLSNFIRHCRERQIETDQAGLPEGVRGLLEIASAVPEREGARRQERKESLLAAIGEETFAFFQSAGEIVAFLGEFIQAFSRFVRGKARYERSDFFLVVQQAGIQALPIVTLISFLVGVILAFVGATQLVQFGATIYVANLVGVAMAQEMGAMMTGIIMAGRTGAAFAAELGTMTVNEEIDALETMGIDPMEFLVVPRMLALMLMMPLLCVYADLMGILGGGILGVTTMGITPIEYFNQTREGLDLTDFGAGLFKSAVYGAIVAISGCLRGMQCARSAASVGNAATSAVVTAIVFIVVASATLTVIFNVLGI